MNTNTHWLLSWSIRMVKKYGQPMTGYDWCRKLAYAVNEEGNDYPSSDAIQLAKQWEQTNPELNEPDVAEV